MKEATMCTELQTAEARVARLIEETNQVSSLFHKPWTYELTAEVANIGVVATDASQTLLVNPSWLHFVISSEDFKACVADEIIAWNLIQELTSGR
jgi:hypothetical protein